MKDCIDCGKRTKEKRCPTCRSRDYRRRNPVRYAFNNLRTNAKRRGHTFTLTFNQFQLFAVKTEYIVNKGTTRDSYSIDRIDPTKGYSIHNIQILTLAQNSQKGVRKQIEWDEYAGALKTTTSRKRTSYKPSEQAF